MGVIILIIISGPSTVGKNPLIYKICEVYNFRYIVPCTTRPMRTEESNGTDYVFLSKREFQTKVCQREITEWDYCLENYYGYTFKFPGKDDQITHGLSRMALRIKFKYPDKITTVFLMPENVDRIFCNVRKIYGGKTLMLRESLIEEELCHSVLFDYVFTCDGSALTLLNRAEMQSLLHTELNHRISLC